MTTRQDKPESIYVWLVPSEEVLEQPGSWRIRKWDTVPFPEATHTVRSSQARGIDFDAWERMVEAGAKEIADSPLIDAPKLKYPSWMGLARSVLEAALGPSAATPAATKRKISTGFDDGETPRMDAAEVSGWILREGRKLERELAEEKARHEACRLLAQGWKEDAERAALSSATTINESAPQAPGRCASTGADARVQSPGDDGEPLSQQSPTATPAAADSPPATPINERAGLGAATEPSRRADAETAPTAEAGPSLPPAIPINESASQEPWSAPCGCTDRFMCVGHVLEIRAKNTTRDTPPTTATTDEAGEVCRWIAAVVNDSKQAAPATVAITRMLASARSAAPSATAITENDARYQWLRVRGCAIDGTEHQREGLVRRCINLDEEIDSLRAVDIRQP